MQEFNNNEEELVTGHIQNGGKCVLPPPKKGEVMICQHCGKAMLPQDFSKLPSVRKREFKWHMHDRCFNAVMDLCDVQTPGLKAERASK